MRRILQQRMDKARETLYNLHVMEPGGKFIDAWKSSGSTKGRLIQCVDPDTLQFLLVLVDTEENNTQAHAAQFAAEVLVRTDLRPNTVIAYGQERHFLPLTAVPGKLSMDTVLYACRQMATCGRCFVVADGKTWPTP